MPYLGRCFSSGGFRISLRWHTNSPGGVRQPVILPKFLPKTAWEWNNLDGEGRVPGVPLDPPLFSTHSYTGDKNVDLRITLKFVIVKRLHLQVAIVRQLVFFSYRPSRCWIWFGAGPDSECRWKGAGDQNESHGKLCKFSPGSRYY